MAQNNKGLLCFVQSGASHEVARSWPHHTHHRVSRWSSHVQHCWEPCQGMKRALGDSHWQLNALTCKWHTSLLLSTHSVELVMWSTQPRWNQDVQPLSSSDGKNISKQHSWPAEVFFQILSVLKAELKYLLCCFSYSTQMDDSGVFFPSLRICIFVLFIWHGQIQTYFKWLFHVHVSYLFWDQKLSFWKSLTQSTTIRAHNRCSMFM